MSSSSTAEDLLRTLVRDHHAEGPEVLSNRILDTFRLVQQSAARAEQPAPAVGQTWRNRQSGRLVRIAEISGARTFRDERIRWESADDSVGPRTGSVFVNNWVARFDHEVI